MTIQRQGIEYSLFAPGVNPRMPAQPSPIASALQQLLGQTADTIGTAASLHIQGVNETERQQDAQLKADQLADIRGAMQDESEGVTIREMITKKGQEYSFKRQAYLTSANIIDDDALLSQITNDLPDRPLPEQFQHWLENNTQDMPPEYTLTLKDEMLPRIVRAYDKRNALERKAHFEDGGQALGIKFGSGNFTDDDIANKNQFVSEWVATGGSKRDALEFIYTPAFKMLVDAGDTEGVSRLVQLAQDDGADDLAVGMYERARTRYELNASESIDNLMLVRPELADSLISDVLNDPNIMNKTNIISGIEQRAKDGKVAAFRAADMETAAQHLINGATTGGVSTLDDSIDPITGTKIDSKERINNALGALMPQLDINQQVRLLHDSGAVYEPWKKMLEIGARGTLRDSQVPANVKAGFQLHESLYNMEGGAGLLGAHEDEKTAAYYALVREIIAERGDDPANPPDSAFHEATQAIVNLPETEVAFKGVADAVENIDDYKKAHNADSMRTAITNRARLYTRKFSVSADRAVAMAVKSLNERYKISNGWWIPRGVELPYGETIGNRAIEQFMAQPVDAKTGEPTGSIIAPRPKQGMFGHLSVGTGMMGDIYELNPERTEVTRAEYYGMDKDDLAFMPRNNGDDWDLVNMATMTVLATSSREALLKEYEDYANAELELRKTKAKAEYQERAAENKAVGEFGGLIPIKMVPWIKAPSRPMPGERDAMGRISY